MADIFKDKTTERADKQDVAVSTALCQADSKRSPLPEMRNYPAMAVHNIQRPRFGREQ
jgi:hypothetical protein